MRGLGRAWQSTMVSIASPTASRIAATQASAWRIGASPSSGIVGGTAIDLNAVKPSRPSRGELAKPLRLVALVEVLHLAAAEVAVEAHVVADGAAPQLVAGDAVHLAEDVPQRDVDAAHRGAADDVAAVPEVLAEHHLPEMLDARRVFADDQLGEVLDGADDRARVPLERRLAPAVRPSWSVRTLTKTQLRMRALQTCASTAVIFMTDSAAARAGRCSRRSAS